MSGSEEATLIILSLIQPFNGSIASKKSNGHKEQTPSISLDVI